MGVKGHSLFPGPHHPLNYFKCSSSAFPFPPNPEDVPQCNRHNCEAASIPKHVGVWVLGGGLSVPRAQEEEGRQKGRGQVGLEEEGQALTRGLTGSWEAPCPPWWR